MVTKKLNMVSVENSDPKNRPFVVFILFLWLGVSSLLGELTQKRQMLFYFDKIEVNGAVDVFVTPGPRNEEALIFADSDIMDNISLTVRERVLFIDANNTYDISRRLPFLKLRAERIFPVEIIIHTEKLSELRLNGKGNLTVTDIRTPKLSIHSTGNGRFHLENASVDSLSVRQDGKGPVILKGQEVSNLDLVVMNDGPVWAQSRPVDRARILHHGNNSVEINSLKFIDARIFGPGNVLLHSKPKSIVVTQKGTGKVVDILPDAPKLYDLNATSPVLPLRRISLRRN